MRTALAAVLLLALTACGATTDDKDTGAEANKAEVSKTPKPSKAPAKPLTPLQDFDKRINDIGHLHGEKLEQNWNGPGTLVVNFDVGDNLSKKLIRVGIAKDVFAIAEAAKKSGVRFKELSFRGMFPLVDKFGEESDGQVFFTTFTRNTVNRINYDEILVTQFDNIEDLAADNVVVLHPDFR